jgi:hypothetical protein
MMLMPAISFDTVMDFNWPELKAWHKIAIQTFKSMRGIE